MHSQIRNTVSRLLLAGPLMLAMGCASEVARPVASAPAPEAPEATGITTTTSTAADARPAVSSTISVSEEVERACNIHANDPSQAPKFDFDRSDLKQDDRAILDQIARCVTTGPLAGHTLTLVGRADPRGEEEYNFALGEHRASSVERYLSGMGVSTDRMTTTSRGKLDATGTNETGWQLDRRVDVDVR